MGYVRSDGKQVREEIVSAQKRTAAATECNPPAQTTHKLGRKTTQRVHLKLLSKLLKTSSDCTQKAEETRPEDHGEIAEGRQCCCRLRERRWRITPFRFSGAITADGAGFFITTISRC